MILMIEMIMIPRSVNVKGLMPLTATLVVMVTLMMIVMMTVEVILVVMAMLKTMVMVLKVKGLSNFFSG